MDTWHHLRGLTEAFSPKKSGKNVILHELQQFRTIVRSGKRISTQIRLLGAFHMIVWSFRMVMRNQFSLFPFWAATKILSVSIHTTVRIFRMFMRNENAWFFNFFLSFPPFLSLDSTSTTSRSTPNPGPNQLHYFFHCAFGSSSTLFFSSIWFISFVSNLSKSYLEMTPKLNKTC